MDDISMPFPAPALQAPGPLATPTFRREGEYWTLAFDGALCRLKHTRGMQHLAAWLGRPGDRVAAGERACTPTAPGADGPASPQAAERARVTVTRQILAVLKRLGAHHPALARHLATTIRTGAFCS